MYRLIFACILALVLVACSPMPAMDAPTPNSRSTQAPAPSPTELPIEESAADESTPDAPTDPELILHLPFDGDGHDVSSNGNHGEIIGATFVADRFGNPSSAIALDGVDDLVRVEHADALNLTLRATFALWWFHQEQASDTFYTLFEKSDPDRDGHSRYGMWLTNNLVEVCIQPASAPFHHCLDSAIALAAGQWVHIAGVIDGSSLRVYINGELAGEKTYSRDVISRSPFNLFVGTDQYQSTPVFTQGVMDDLRIYKRALTAAEVQTLSTEGLEEDVTESAPDDSPSDEHVAGTWTEVGMVPTPRSEMRGALIDGLIYVPGGWGGESTLEAYNPETGEWRTLADLPQGRHHFMATAHDSLLYLIGGSPARAYRPTTTAWVYDPTLDTWREIAPMPEMRMGGAAVALGAAIYVVGGESTASSSQPTLRYDPDADAWTELASMNQLREHIAAVAYDGKIYAFGGWWRGSGEFTSLEIYDPITDTWTPGPDMQVPRGGLAAVVVGDQIFVVGGEVLSAQHTETSVEVFDPATQTWLTAPNLPVGRHGFPLINVNGVLWLIGGSDRAGAAENQGQVLQFTQTGG